MTERTLIEDVLVSGHPLSAVRYAEPFGNGPSVDSPDGLFGDLGFIAALAQQSGWNDLPFREVRERFRALEARYQGLRALAEHKARRGAGYTPGDAAALLVAHAGPILGGAQLDLRGLTVTDLIPAYGAQLEHALFAVPYYLPPAAGIALVGSHAPPADLIAETRLPFSSVLVLFGGPLQFGPASKWVTRSTNCKTQWEVLHNEGGTLNGVVLCADGSGQPFNLAIYLLSLGLTPDAPAAFIPGELRYGAFASVAANAASIVSWGSWNEPDLSQAVSPVMAPADVRHVVRRGAFRRRSWSGIALGAHTIDLGRTFEGRSGVTTGSTVAPHLRRGHWRRVRLGPRADWQYEGR